MPFVAMLGCVFSILFLGLGKFRAGIQEALYIFLIFLPVALIALSAMFYIVEPWVKWTVLTYYTVFASFAYRKMFYHKTVFCLGKPRVRGRTYSREHKLYFLLDKVLFSGLILIALFSVIALGLAIFNAVVEVEKWFMYVILGAYIGIGAHLIGQFKWFVWYIKHG
jgi:hypothetical protein